MKKMLVILFVLSLVSMSYGEYLVGWDVNGQPGDEASLAPSFAGSNIASNTCLITRGVGCLEADIVGDSFAADHWQQGDSLVTSSNSYFSFVVAGESGFAVSITNFSANLYKSGTAADYFSLRSSVDGFASSLHDWTQADSGNMDQDVSLNLAAASSIELRIYGWGSTTTAGSGRIRNLSGDDVEIMGTVTAVPEPATLGFMLVGLAGVFFARRRVNG